VLKQITFKQLIVVLATKGRFWERRHQVGAKRFPFSRNQYLSGELFFPLHKLGVGKINYLLTLRTKLLNSLVLVCPVTNFLKLNKIYFSLKSSLVFYRMVLCVIY